MLKIDAFEQKCRRERKAVELGQEPPETAAKGKEEGGATATPAATIMLRLADGSRVRRRFLRADSMGKVLDWADVQGMDLDAQRLSSSFPKVRVGRKDNRRGGGTRYLR